MVYFNDPSEVVRDDLILLKLWYCVAGLYLWEFITTLSYEWGVIRGHRPYRWTIWIYSLTRVTCLLGVIISLVGIDVTTPINCQAWIVVITTFVYLSAAGASLLIVLRIAAVWDRNKGITTAAISVLGIEVLFFIHGAANIRATWVPTQLICVVTDSGSRILTLIAMVVTDIALLLIMLIGLLRLRRQGGGTFGISQLLWKQGVYWLFLASMAGVPPIVLSILDLNDPLNSMFQVPSLITMAISATRMHRSLVDFSTRSSEGVHSDHQIGGLMFWTTKRTHPRVITFQRTEISMDVVFEQHSTPQMRHADPCSNTVEGVNRKPSSSGFDDDMECGVNK